MRISMYGEVKFYVDVDLNTVLALRRLALCHYDSVCKGTAAPDGILTRWEQDLLKKQSGNHSDWNKAWWPKATWRELDTLAKVCESAQLFYSVHTALDGRLLIDNFIQSVVAVLRDSGQITKAWEHDFPEPA